jgi:hypothetical protein
MRLYHFTCLFHLPEVLRDGLANGQFPVRPGLVLNAPGFTSNPSPQAQHWAAGSLVDKLKVRLEADVPDDHREPWRPATKRLKVDRNFLRNLDTHGQGKFWYVYWGVVPASRILTVAVRSGPDYRSCSGPELDKLLSDIVAERSRLEFVRGEDGALLVHTPDGTNKSWLIDGAPAPSRAR